jgi:hypothetical protein
VFEKKQKAKKQKAKIKERKELKYIFSFKNNN